MPRRNRRAPVEPAAAPAPRSRSEPPPWSAVPGFEVRQVAGDKPYRCPGCDHTIRAGLWHLVVIPDGDPDARRHWHSECWRKELRRTGVLRRSDGEP